jgi:hypothetical protein
MLLLTSAVRICLFVMQLPLLSWTSKALHRFCLAPLQISTAPFCAHCLMLPSAAAASEAHAAQALHRQMRREEQESEQSTPYNADTHDGQGAPGPSSARMFTHLRANRSGSQRCANDCLHCIFEFLSLRERAPVFLTCKEWYAAMQSEPTRQLRLSLGSPAWGLLQLSPLRRHVDELLDEGDEVGRLSYVLGLGEHLPELSTLWIHLDGKVLKTELEQMATELGSEHRLGAHIAAHLPATLTFLGIKVNVVGDRDDQTLVDLAGRIPSLEHLQLSLYDEIGCHIDLRPLTALRHLEEFELNSVELDDHTINQLRKMQSLRALNLHSGCVWSSNTLVDLCSPGHRLTRLTGLDLYKTNIDAMAVEALSNLPSLLQLESSLFEADAFPLLPLLLNLQKLCVDFEYPKDAPSLTEIVPHLCACRSLTHLELPEMDVFQGDVAMIVQELPNLRFLMLSSRAGSIDLAEVTAVRQIRMITRDHFVEFMSRRSVFQLVDIPHQEELWVATHFHQVDQHIPAGPQEEPTTAAAAQPAQPSRCGPSEEKDAHEGAEESKADSS